MLVLTRKLHEQICIGDNVTISVLKIKGNTVRIGIDAPRDVRVLRGEIPQFDTEDRCQDENGKADTERAPLGLEHTPLADGNSQRPPAVTMPHTSHLRRLVRQVVSAHAV